MRSVALSLVVILSACAADDGPPPEPTPVGSILADHLGSVQGSASGAVQALGYHVAQLADATALWDIDSDRCAALQNDLWGACDEITSAGLAQSCGAQTAFFYANDTPRCGVRVSLWDGGEVPTVISFDFDGTVVPGWSEMCGNGRIDPGEACDDGNHDDWDGCDPSCQMQQFTGCETVIEHYFDAWEIAHVDATTWREPRTHLMVHGNAAPLRPLDASLCSAAAATAQDVCNELVTTMPFVSTCTPTTVYEANACAVRLEVSFSKVSPEDAVFTTRLTGILAFTIR